MMIRDESTERSLNRKIFLSVTLLFGVFILASVPNLGKISFWPPDADKIAMDGVFVHDFLKDLPHSILHPYQYAIEYYTRYPSLSVGERPLFFPAVEAVFYTIMGLNHMAPRVAVLLFLYVGMLSWAFLVTRTHNFRVAVISLLLWASNLHIYIFAQNILLEIPTLAMCMLTLYLLYRYVSEPSVRMAVLLGVVTGLMLWTNQKSAFMLPMFFLYPLLSRNPRLFLAGSTWLLAAVVLTFLIPLTIISIWLGEYTIALATKGLMAPEQVEIVKEGHSQLFVYLHYLYQDYFFLPIFLLAFVGIFLAMFKKDRNSILYGLVIFCVYLTFTIISVKIPRYAIYWIPPFCFFAALAAVTAADKLAGRIKRGKTLIAWALCSIPVIFQIWTSFPIHIYHVSGYEAAARYVLKHSQSPVIFFTGMGNGQFSFFVRTLDPHKAFMILRGQKTIAESFVHYDYYSHVYLQNQREIYNYFQNMGVQYAVVESPLHPPHVPAFIELMTLLQDPEKFTLEKTFPIKISPSSDRRDYKLLVFRNRYSQPINKKQEFTLRVPATGKTLRLTLGQMVGKKDN